MFITIILATLVASVLYQDWQIRRARKAIYFFRYHRDLYKNGYDHAEHEAELQNSLLLMVGYDSERMALGDLSQKPMSEAEKSAIIEEMKKKEEQLKKSDEELEQSRLLYESVE
ncbi:hypothetical protein FPFC_060980 [Fructobacillus pseudoficulneus]|uniref:Uncharacterized protein n=1 Tax=Fructobacillus pseudoficulneus TaxID=220714 RepID=A0A3F3GVQ0_9LACO|nr:hypothetical protein [Fructobacillus pseudoficulneus]GAP03375.1 hypothetical protein FPFC_060980 [Fructobacillus pseudoficulneus]SEH43665.1 hypothetical protein SAMN05660469_1056 [Fructobacillus pseudoficulneus]